MGDSEPLEVINFETFIIPFKHASMSLADWNDTFRTWTGNTPGWKNWYLRMDSSMRGHWGKNKISQCINLSLSNNGGDDNFVVIIGKITGNLVLVGACRDGGGVLVGIRPEGGRQHNSPLMIPLPSEGRRPEAPLGSGWRIYRLATAFTPLLTLHFVCFYDATSTNTKQGRK
jgi:hypothetical protein